jgi:hypothetical protein
MCINGILFSLARRSDLPWVPLDLGWYIGVVPGECSAVFIDGQHGVTGDGGSFQLHPGNNPLLRANKADDNMFGFFLTIT